MRKNDVKRLGIGVAAVCLSVSMIAGEGAGAVPGMPSVVMKVHAEEAGEIKLGDSFEISDLVINSWGATFEISSKNPGESLFEKYWSHTKKVLLDDKDFGFEPKQSYGDVYQLYNGQVTIHSGEAKEYLKAHEAHKIEFFFDDGSKTDYTQEGYVKPKDADEEKPGENQQLLEKYSVSEAKIEEDWAGKKQLTINLEDGQSETEFMEHVKGIDINGNDLKEDQIKGAEISDMLGIRIKDANVVAFMKEDNNKIVFTMDDGKKVEYNSNKEQEDPKENEGKWNGKDVVKKIEKSEWGKGVKITVAEGIKVEDLLKETKAIRLNGQEFPKDYFSRSILGEIIQSNNDAVGEAWKKDRENTVQFVFENGESAVYPKVKDNGKEDGQEEKDDNKKADLKITDKLDDGTYTIGFNALYADGREGTSMLEGFFDKNVRLDVKEGKMRITMLNLLFAHGFIDFAVQNNGEWVSMNKEYHGKPDSAGDYSRAKFSMDIENLDQVHLAGVLVSYMGGLESQKNDFDKYTKVLLKFKPDVQKGFEEYAVVKSEEEAKARSKDLLNKKLVANNCDVDGDGTVTAEDLKKFKGDINIGSIVIDGFVDRDAIYGVDEVFDLLKNMGPEVKSFRSDSNVLGELPKDLFANATNIEEIRLGGSGITKLPEEIFAKNKKLKRVNLSANVLGELPTGLFMHNKDLRELSLDQAWLREIPEGILDSLGKLEQLSLWSNQLEALPKDLFKNTKKLYFVNLSDNDLKELPESVGKLDNLSGFHAYNNELTTVPNDLGKSGKLKELNLNYNHLANLPDHVWIVLAKNNGTLRMVGNDLTDIPLDLIKANGAITKMDIANNMLPVDFKYSKDDSDKLGIDPTKDHAYYPQRGAVTLKAEAKDGMVRFAPEGNKTILNLYHWFTGRSTYYGGEGILQGSEKYDEFMAKQTKPLAELLKTEYDKNWEITTKVERIRGDKVKEISANTVRNEDDVPGQVEDKQMKNGDVYRVTKILYKRTTQGNSERLFTISTETSATSEKQPEKAKVQKFEVPIRVVQASDMKTDSMANGAVGKTAIAEIKDGEAKLILTFQPMFLEEFNATGHLTKLGYFDSLEKMRKQEDMKDADVEETYEEKGIKYPRVYKLALNGKPDQVGIKVWVDMMDALARKTGKEDGPQIAVINLDWKNAKEIVQEEPEEKDQTKPENKDDQTSQTKDNNQNEQEENTSQIDNGKDNGDGQVMDTQGPKGGTSLGNNKKDTAKAALTKNAKKSGAKTGDTVAIATYISMLIVAIGAAFAVFFKRKRVK